jgi:hypothetical protein
MTVGDLVEIAGPPGVVVGRVEELRPPQELPDLPELSSGAARAVLAELEVSRVALLSYHYGAQRVVFAALESSGQWFDLRGQQLTLRRIDSPYPD